MSLSIGDLKSRAIRSSIGKRIYSFTGGGLKKDENGGILGSIFGGLAKFAGFLLGGLLKLVSSIITWSISAVWGLFCAGVQFFWTFEWNTPDDQLDQSLQTAWEAFGGVLGGAVGNTLGNLVVAGGGATLFCFNEPMGLYVLKAIGEEALEEAANQAANVIRAAAPLAARWLFNTCFKKIRTAMGLNPDSVYMTDAQMIEEIIAGRMTRAQMDKNKAGRDALKAERKPWSFAKAFEEWKESIDDKFVQNFIEEAFDEFFDAIVDMGYVAASAVDGFIASHKLGHQASTGATQQGTVEITFDRSLDDEPDPTPTT